MPVSLRHLLLVCALVAAPPVAAQDVIGALDTHRVRAGDTLHDVAIAHGIGYVEMIAANPGIDPWVPYVGSTVVLPTAHVLPRAPRDGLVLNLADMRVYWFPPVGAAESFPVGIGRVHWGTPTGTTTVVGKRAHPTWRPPASIRAERPGLPDAVPPGPDNPLGDHAIDLGWEGYVIHGTNRPYGIGRRVSHGCVRLHPADIARLFDALPLGTPVTVVDQPVKLGWGADGLYLEVHPAQDQADALELTGRVTPRPIPGLETRIRDVAGAAIDRVDWPAVARTARERRGVPVLIAPDEAGS